MANVDTNLATATEENTAPKGNQKVKDAGKKGKGGKVVPINKNAEPESGGESSSLNSFSETLKDILQDITSLEVNTMIVAEITLAGFVPEDFLAQAVNDMNYRTEQGMVELKTELLQRRNQLASEGTQIDPNDAEAVEQHRQALQTYNDDLEAYKDAEEEMQVLTEAQRDYYLDARRQIRALDIDLKQPLDEVKLTAAEVRKLRKIWEMRNCVINGDRIFAQTKLGLDGDLTNRYVKDLFETGKESKFPFDTTRLVLELHRIGVENAEQQWKELIDLVIGLVKDLFQFRKA
ncbi:MAG: hypothetical protein WCO45_02700 [Pseudanabaena sp. ELA607]|jgi:hypothetical protein